MARTASEIALLAQVKIALRLSVTTFDNDEIYPIIDACKIDLWASGILKTENDDPLIVRAIVLYAKANFGFSEDSEKYHLSYTLLKNSMALCAEYNSYQLTFTVTGGGLGIKGAIIQIGDIALLTNSLGVAIYNTREINKDVDYTLSYLTTYIEDSVYITGDTAESVVIV